MNSIFAKISSRENISNSLFAKFSSRENKVLYSIRYVHKPSHNAELAIDTLLLQMKNSDCEQVLVYITNSVYCLSGG